MAGVSSKPFSKAEHTYLVSKLSFQHAPCSAVSWHLKGLIGVASTDFFEVELTLVIPMRKDPTKTTTLMASPAWDVTLLGGIHWP